MVPADVAETRQGEEMPDEVAAGRGSVAPVIVAAAMLQQPVLDGPATSSRGWDNVIKGRVVWMFGRYGLAAGNASAAPGAQMALGMAQAADALPVGQS